MKPLCLLQFVPFDQTISVQSLHHRQHDDGDGNGDDNDNDNDDDGNNDGDDDDDDDDDPFLNCFSDKDKLIQGKSSKGNKCTLPSFILNIINININISIINTINNNFTIYL